MVKGDVQAGFKEADVIVEKTYTTTWIEHAYLEPDAGIAYLDEEGRITVLCPTQNVHYDQKDVASTLGLPLEKVRIIQSATGGGFGGRLDITVHCFWPWLFIICESRSGSFTLVKRSSREPPSAIP